MSVPFILLKRARAQLILAVKIIEDIRENCLNLQHKAFETMAKKEELTTAMHAELMDGEMTREELAIWAVKGAMNRGLSKEEACERYGFTVSEWEGKYMKLTFSQRGDS